jgi:hypothetical protein
VVASCQRCDHYRDLAQTSIPHSAPLPATAQLPATSCLGAFWSPAASARGQSRHSGDQKPAQDETSSGPLPPCREGRVSRQEWQGPRERELEDLRLTRICANSWLLELPIWSLSSCEGTRRGSKDCDEICKCLRIKYAVPKVSSGPLSTPRYNHDISSGSSDRSEPQPCPRYSQISTEGNFDSLHCRLKT